MKSGGFAAGRRRIVRLRAALLAAALTAGPLAAPPAMAQDDPEAQRELDEAARLAMRTVEKMLGALELFIDDLPQYAAPEVLPNGDILIRRLNPKTEDGGAQPATPDARDALRPEEPRPEGRPLEGAPQEMPQAPPQRPQDMPAVPPSERNPDASGGERRI